MVRTKGDDDYDRKLLADVDLPMGWQAMRDGPDQPWERMRNTG